MEPVYYNAREDADRHPLFFVVLDSWLRLIKSAEIYYAKRITNVWRF